MDSRYKVNLLSFSCFFLQRLSIYLFGFLLLSSILLYLFFYHIISSFSFPFLVNSHIYLAFCPDRFQQSCSGTNSICYDSWFPHKNVIWAQLRVHDRSNLEHDLFNHVLLFHCRRFKRLSCGKLNTV